MKTATDRIDHTVSVPEAARRLNVTTRDVYERIRTGDLPIIREDGMFRVPIGALPADAQS